MQNSNKNSFDISKLKLAPASINDYPVIQNMARFYVYDMSEFLGFESGWEIPKDGLYECNNFKKYWETSDAFPFLIYYQDELAGFVIADKKGSDASIEFNMAQFFVLRKFKGKGVGRAVAFQCFDKFLGKWEVMVLPGNSGAYTFWHSIISRYTNDRFQEYSREVAHFDNGVRDIFSFISHAVKE